MKAAALAIGLAIVTACAGAAPEPARQPAPPISASPVEAPPVEAPPVAAPPIAAPPTPAPPVVPISMPGPPAPYSPPQTPLLIWDGAVACKGAFAQGGIVVCRGAPGTVFTVDGDRRVVADDAGIAVFGLSREQGRSLSIAAAARGQTPAASFRFDVARRTFVTQSVSGLPPATVRPPDDPAIQAKIARERDLKNAGSASREPVIGFVEGFVWPVTGARQSGAWGNQRILNGDPRPPHMGMDIAAPAGTPIRAPAPGKVTLAQSDMHFEGGLVFIDHGQGMITQYLHMSRVDVKAGEWVGQGQTLGAVGATGRATGPHLCWRMRVRETQVDPGQAILALVQARQAFAGLGSLEAGAAPAGWTGR